MGYLRRLCGLVLCAALLLPGTAQAQGKYPDLPESHWAYEDMDRAAELGILRGMEDGRMAPEETLTWGQYLTMLTRAFYPATYAAVTDAGAAWDQAGYWAAWDNGLIIKDDILPVDPADLSRPILRQDAAVLLDRVLPHKDIQGRHSGSGDGWWDKPSFSRDVFSDYAALDPPYQEALDRLYDAYIVNGREDGTFGGGETIRRCDGTVLLLRTFLQVDLCEIRDMTVTLHFVDRQGNPVREDLTVETHTGEFDAMLALDDPSLRYYRLLSDWRQITSLQTEYTLVYQPFTQAEIAKEEFILAAEKGEASWDDFDTQPFWLAFQGENQAKSLLLFGNTEQLRFPDEATAQASMTAITVPVWHLDRNGNRVPAEASLTVHAAIAQDVTAIFTEIYNDPEQFPIHDVGGYGWRGDSATGEHNCGTAIDINWEENYQIRDGKVLAGSLWQPGTNPYSISSDSSVVRIFAAHGWSWGGDAWAYSSDDSEGYHDYMHFSYMGR